MANRYTFAKNPPVNIPVLISQINSSAIGINVVDAHYQGSTSTMIVDMASALSPAQLNILTTVVAAHDGTPKPFNIGFPMPLFDDFITGNASSALGWTATVSNGGIFSLGSLSGAQHPGIVAMSTGALPTGAAAYHLGLSDITAGSTEVDMEFMVRVNNLGSAQDNFTFRIGLGDVATGNFQNGGWIEYNFANSPNWSTCTANAGVQTSVASAFAVDTGWHKFSLVFASDGSQVQFFVDDGAIGEVTTNFPVSTPVGPIIQLAKTLGTTPCSVLIDYFWMVQKTALS